MGDDDCRGVRAEADALRAEIALLRGVVSVLRAPAGQKKKARRWAPLAIAFLAGVALAWGICLLMR